jgi:hypothetical protein
MIPQPRQLQALSNLGKPWSWLVTAGLEYAIGQILDHRSEGIICDIVKSPPNKEKPVRMPLSNHL